jgi:hypothetical protein
LQGVSAEEDAVYISHLALDFHTKLLMAGFVLAGAALAWRTIGQLYLQLRLCAATVLVYIYLDHRRLPLAPNLRLLLVESAVFVSANLEPFWELSAFSAMGLFVQLFWWTATILCDCKTYKNLTFPSLLAASTSLMPS